MLFQVEKFCHKNYDCYRFNSDKNVALYVLVNEEASCPTWRNELMAFIRD
jgi:hypothetical protein